MRIDFAAETLFSLPPYEAAGKLNQGEDKGPTR